MSTAETSSDKRDTRILVVDDDPEILNMLEMRLSNCGYDVTTAIDGEDAIEKATSGAIPHVIVLDVMMPKMNGWEVARALRQEESTKNVKIIMLTAIGPHVNEMTSPLYGANAHLDKPFDFKELEANIKQLLGTESHD